MPQSRRDACLPLQSSSPALQLADPIPAYLDTYYWWAYVHPQAVRVFERQWLANAILWGNYARLRDSALTEFDGTLNGRTLQVACAYGDLTSRLCERLPAHDGTLDVVDILPIQLDNLQRKLPASAPVRLHTMDSSALDFADGRFDRALLFFLLHEQPRDVRERTLAVKSGGWSSRAAALSSSTMRCRIDRTRCVICSARCWRRSNRSRSTCGAARSPTGCRRRRARRYDGTLASAASTRRSC